MMRLGRKKDKDKEEKDKDKEKKDKKDKKEKKEKRKSLSTKKPSSSSSKKRTIKAKIEIHPQAISNLPIDLNNSILFLSWKRGAKKSNRGESKRCALHHVISFCFSFVRAFSSTTALTLAALVPTTECKCPTGGACGAMTSRPSPSRPRLCSTRASLRTRSCS